VSPSWIKLAWIKLAWIKLARIALGCSLLVAAGCSSLSTDVPHAFDLSGDWVIVGSAPDAQVGHPARTGHSDRAGRHGRGANVGFDPATLPMIDAQAMVIEQDATSMGIAYQNGTYRDVSWGERDLRLAEVEAGWDGPDLVIETEGRSYDMVERYRLGSDGNLRLEIHLDPARGDQINVVHIYRRRVGAQ
jgi:hypothetical protein